MSEHAERCAELPGHAGWLSCPQHGAEIRAMVEAMASKNAVTIHTRTPLHYTTDPQPPSNPHSECQSTIAELRREIAVDDQLLAERDRVLDALLCDAHGRCVPHALETIERLRTEIRILSEKLEEK